MKLDALIYNLLKDEPYYAYFLLNCQINYEQREPKEDAEYVTTAVAEVRNNVVSLHFNVPFMNKFNQKTQIAVLKHEVLHLLFKHTSIMASPKALNKKIWNIAMDCAINQYISNLPIPHITVEQLEKLTNSVLERKQTSTYYFNALYQKAEELEASGQLPGTLDDHDYLMSESDANSAEAAAAVEQAAAKALRAAAGQVSSDLQSVLKNLMAPPQVDWRAQLRNLVASAISTKTIGTRKKAHRRFELEQPGRKRKHELKLAVCVDSSGSISEEQFIAFINEIIHLSKQAAEVNLIYADSEVTKVINLKNGKKPPFKRYGNGGTAYQPAITKATELGANCVAYLGDFDCSDKPKDPGIPFIWVGVGNQEPPASFGRVLRIRG